MFRTLHTPQQATCVKKAVSIFWLATRMLIMMGLTQGHASTYFISNEGDDNADGLSEATAWRTLTNVNTGSFLPGDAILFRRGDAWQKCILGIPSSGDEGNPITFGAYGDGPKPKLLGSIKVDSWSRVAENVWVSPDIVPINPYYIDSGAQIFFEKKDGRATWGRFSTYSSDFTNLNKEFDWTHSGDAIYIFSPTDPNTRYQAVQAPQVTQIIRLRDNEFITIDSLTIQYAINCGIYDQYATVPLRGLRVTNCDIGYIGLKNSSSAYGLSVHQSDAYYGYNNIHDCGRRGISLTMYETAAITVENILIEHNHFYNGFHTTGVDAINAGPHSIQGIIIQKNLFSGNPGEDLQADGAFNSNHIYTSNDGSGSIGGIIIQNNIFTYSHASAIKANKTGNVTVINNTFYKFNPTLGNSQAFVYTSKPPEAVTIKNNIFYHNPDTSSQTDIKLDSGYEDRFEIDYNLYYHEHPGTRLYWCSGGRHYNANESDAYTAATGFDQHSIFQTEPGFIDPEGGVFVFLADSPARGAGVTLDGLASDFKDNPINTPPDLGAIQYRAENFWAGYPIIYEDMVNTGDWLGWLSVRYAPYVYSYTLGNFLFIDEALVTATGSWAYVFAY